MIVAVLAGGVSPEHDVSMNSGARIASALAARGHKVALCDIALPVSVQPRAVFGGTEREFLSVADAPPEVKRSAVRGERLIGDGVAELITGADVCFLALHGGGGEDGHVEAMLECLGVAYTGSDMASCHAAMDKYISKLICRDAGIPVPRGIVLKRGEKPPRVDFPAVVKPCSCGSSVGVSIVDDENALASALDNAFSFEERVLIEEKVTGREFSVSVLGGRALPSVEILPHGGKYDFQSKYQSGMTDEICPGRLSQSEEKGLGRLALKAHASLGLGDYSRSDFICDEKTKTFYYLETNALPGMTENSLMPLAARAVGIEYGELCEMICALALERKKK